MRFVQDQSGRSVMIGTGAGAVEVRFEAGDARPGDIVRVADSRLHVLTPNRADGRATWAARILDPRRRKALACRGRVEAAIREFFNGRGFVETRTPVLVPCPGMEPHIRPFKVEPLARDSAAGRVFLPTSPEFAMKRLLVGGLERIFQLSTAFRDEPLSTTHRPEFTMLEWYRAYAGYEAVMEDVEQLFAEVAIAVHGRPEIEFQGRRISVRAPWPRLRVRDLFVEHAGVDLARATTRESLAVECARLGLATAADMAADTWDDLYFRIWLNVIEPRLPADRAVFVLRYPPSQAALAVVDEDPDGTPWARRFEAYAGGIELGNAFEELTDPVEQRRRFVEDMNLRARVYGDAFAASPIDEGFLDALAEGMPPAGGIAMGVDRMVMLFADEPDIDYVFWI